MKRVLVVLCLALGAARAGAPQDRQPHAAIPPQIVEHLRLQGATVYTQDDVLWLLGLREGAPLTRAPAEVATALQERYDRDGYSEARVSAAFDAGTLTLTVDEGRIDDIEVTGVAPADAARFRRLLAIEPGDVYNKRVIGLASARLIAESGGAMTIGQPRRSQPGAVREGGPGEVVLERRGGRNVLVIPLRWNSTRTRTTLGSGREDLFSPADGLAPAVGISATIFDHTGFNHTYIDGYVSYKFGRDDPGYSFGAERPLFQSPARLFVGAEAHDVTASDDLWRISTLEQTLVTLAFKNTFRDYYRRHGAQVFGVLRAGDNNEWSLMARWDRHEPLPNATSYSFFRDSAAFRPPPAIRDQHVNALVLGYTFDTRALTAAGSHTTYARHLRDDLYGFPARRDPGLRVEWTSEVAGHGLGGDAVFDRHIVNARGHLPLSPRTLVSMRALFGFSNGTLPEERLFAIGGIGTVHGYAFKEATGTSMALLNAEYRLNLASPRPRGHDTLSAFAFYDAGRVSRAAAAASTWMHGVGLGVGLAGVRLEIGFRANDIPRSRQILLRFSPTF